VGDTVDEKDSKNQNIFPPSYKDSDRAKPDEDEKESVTPITSSWQPAIREFYYDTSDPSRPRVA